MRLKTRKLSEPRDRHSQNGRIAVRGADRTADLLDDALARYARARLVSSREVLDLLLDLRSAVVLNASFGSLLEDLDRRPEWSRLRASVVREY